MGGFNMKKFVKLVLILVTVVVLVIFVNFYLLQVEKPEPSSDVTPPQDLAPLQQEQESSPPPTQLPPVTIEPSEIGVAPKPLTVTSAPVEDVTTLQALRTRTVVVDWETARRHTPLEPGILSESQQATVDSIDVPVLLPNNPQLLKAMILTSYNGGYGASIDYEDDSIFITASGKKMDLPSEIIGSFEAPLYGDHQRGAQQIEGIMELDFVAFGVGYSMYVECTDRQRDPRPCTEEEYILKIADELVMAGGSGFKEEVE